MMATLSSQLSVVDKMPPPERIDPLALVERKYAAPHWIFLRELRDDTGFQSRRSADAVAVGIYHSRGQLLLGFESKISRSDWLRELKAPGKAESVCQFCDHWNVVIPDETIVEMAELPPNWGLLLTNGRRLKVLKAAPRLNPRPLDRGMLASLVQRAMREAVAPYAISDGEKITEAEERGFERGQRRAEDQLREFSRLQQVCLEFEKASGIKLNHWTHPKEIGEAARAVMEHSGVISRARNDLERTANTLEELAELMRRKLASIRTEARA